jgi:hypothetical protein
MEYRGYDTLQELMEALIRDDTKTVDEIAEELKRFLNSCSDFDRRFFVSDLVDAMQIWAKDIKMARQFKELVKDVMFFMYENDII